MKNLLWGILFSIMGLTFSVSAQSGQETTTDGYAYSKEEISPRTLDRRAWQNAKKGMDFDKSDAKPKINSENRQAPFSLNPETGLLWIRIVVIIIALVALFFLIRSWMGMKTPVNRKLSDEGAGTPTMEDVESGFMEMDLKKLVQHAIANEQYAAAVRLYYLQIIKILAHKGFIHWKKEKTNSEYANELRQTVFYETFLELTRLFELVRYGEGIVNKRTFEKIEPRMSAFIGLMSDE